MLIIGDDLVALSRQGQGSPEGQTTSYGGGSTRRDHWNWPLSHPCGFHLHLTHVKVVIPGLLNIFFITIDTRPSSRQEIPHLRTPQPGHLVHVDTQLELSQRKAMTELHVLLQILLSPDEPTDYTRCSSLKTFYLTLPSARPDGSEKRCYLSVFLSHSLVKCKPFACWSPSNWEQESGQVWPILYTSLPTKKRDALKVSMVNAWQGTGGYKFGRGRKLLRILCPPNLFVFSLDTSLHHLLKAPQRGPVTQESSAKPEDVFSTAGVDRPLCLKGQRETLSLLATAASFRML